jgi:hypothetical protein
MYAQALHVDRRVAGIPNDEISHYPQISVMKEEKEPSSLVKPPWSPDNQ